MASLRRFLVALGVLSLAGVASAHDVTATRFEAPIPLPLLFGGAGATVALTALFLARSESEGATDARSTGADDTRRVSVPESAATVGRTLLRVGFLAAFAGALFVGLTGTRTYTENAAIVFVWALWLKGLAVLAVLVGDPWSTLSPWRTLYDALARLEGEAIRLRAYPDWLGEWPALVGFLAVVGVLENLTWVPRSPRWTAILLAGYAAAMVVGAVVFGREWLRRADFFAVLYRLFGRVAPVTWERTAPAGPDREAAGSGTSIRLTVELRPPWRACRRPVSLPVAAFVVAAVYTVSFDGFANTPEYQSLLFGVRDATGLGPAVSLALYLVGYVGFLAAFAGVAGVTARTAGGHVRFGDVDDPNVVERAADWRGAARNLAPTLLPIAVAYELAHNAAFVLTRFGALVGLLGGPELAPLSWLSLPAFWATQVALIVAGHVVAVVAAHGVVAGEPVETGRATLPAMEPGAGVRHAPLTVLMVGYTVLSLWIISRPVVA
ncbi:MULTISPECIES: hypothetical protein [Halorussus]|uniref:hypothetical protein n=1 Tax=Halorussus TaxID=1070314 RepID=UPI0020A1C615|nr:hypothetical protein [Halorussus vallis]USZ78124.1 hypothetical protein NGM07_20920 [Halorussus vallis]